MNETKRKILFAILFVIFTISISIGLGLWTDLIQVLGRRFSDPQMSRGYIYAFIWASLIGIALLAIPFNKEIHRDVVWVWGLRTIITLVFMVFYESYYILDAQGYYREAQYGNFGLPDFGDGSGFVIWVSQYFYEYLPLANSYHTLKVIFSLFGMLGVFLFYSAYCEYTQKQSRSVFWILNMFPSILFWSSIYGKDPLVLFGLGLFFYGTILYFKSKKLKYFFLAFIGLIFASYIRTWLAGIFTLPLVASFIISRKNGLFMKSGMIAVSVTIYILVIQPYLLKLNIVDINSFLKSINNMSKLWAMGGSGQTIQNISSAKDFFLYLPKGAFTAVFRPLPGEINNPFGILSGFENLALLIFTFSYLVRYNIQLFKNSVLLYLILTIMAWTSIYAFISPQNLGTAVRFKLQILPFIVLIPYFAEYEFSKKNQAAKMPKPSSSVTL